jgi:hypothetical protein
VDPVNCRRRDCQSGLTEGLAYGLPAGLAVGLLGGIVGGIGAGLATGLITALGVSVAFTISVSQSWLATVGFLLLGHAGLFPRQGIHFLEDARQRGVLRTVGSVYQFRHARLQDQLATTYARHPGSVNDPGRDRKGGDPGWRVSHEGRASGKSAQGVGG